MNLRRINKVTNTKIERPEDIIWIQKNKSKLFNVTTKNMDNFYKAIPIKLTDKYYKFVMTENEKAIIVKLIDENKYTAIRDKNLVKQFENNT